MIASLGTSFSAAPSQVLRDAAGAAILFLAIALGFTLPLPF
jgi:hypothetical protein